MKTKLISAFQIFSFSAFLCAGCATHNGWPWYMRSDSNKQTPPLPPKSVVKAMSPKDRASQPTLTRAAVAPPAPRKPMEVEILSGTGTNLSDDVWQVQTTTNLLDPNSWTTVQHARQRFFWMVDKSEKQRFFRVYQP